MKTEKSLKSLTYTLDFFEKLNEEQLLGWYLFVRLDTIPARDQYPPLFVRLIKQFNKMGLDKARTWLTEQEISK